MMTVINYETFIIVEMIRNSCHMTSDNLAQTIETVVNHHNKNTKIKNVTEVEIVSVINQRVTTIDHQIIQRIKIINIKNNISFLKSNLIIKRIFSRHIM